MSAMVGDWLYAIGSNVEFNPALTAALILLALVLIMLMLSLAFDLFKQSQERRAAALRKTWIPILFAATTEAEAPPDNALPRLTRRDTYQFILLWNALYDTMHGGSISYQRSLADHMQLLPTLRRWLRHGRMDYRIAAIICSGHLREHAAWPWLVKRLDKADTVESLSSARALVQIDALSAMPMIWRHLERNDWSPSRVTALLANVPASTLRYSMLDFVDQLSAETLHKMMRIAEALLHNQFDDIMVSAMRRFPNDYELKAQTCNNADDPRWLPLIRDSINAHHVGLRVAATKALGRIGEPQDRSLLIHALIDDQWWVRYRAAQSLTRLPGVTTIQLQRLANEHPSPDARAILAHVLAENTA